MNAADIMRAALAEIAALPSAQQDEGGTIARQALEAAAAAEPRRDYAAGLAPEDEAAIKQATFAFFQSLVDTARESPETFRQMIGNAKRQQAQADSKRRDGIILAKAPAILDLRAFNWPGKTTN